MFTLRVRRHIGSPMSQGCCVVLGAGTFLHVDGGLGSMAPARAGDSKSVKQN